MNIILFFLENENTPMSRIQKNRSKWRENPSMNLEESWGSLNQFNKCQRGRLSLDMDGMLSSSLICL